MNDLSFYFAFAAICFAVGNTMAGVLLRPATDGDTIIGQFTILIVAVAAYAMFGFFSMEITHVILSS